MRELPFDFEMPVSVFEKSDADPGKQRRIGGIVSTERPDRQDDTILQRGLDFSDFLSHGWFNDNHSPKMTDILGYPEEVKLFHEGARLPNGEIAKATGTWAEGYLLDTPKGDEVWNTARALQKTGRRLGFSVEGSIQRRTGPLRKTIARAKVCNVAITHCPVNGDSKLEILAKSLESAESAADEFDKALGMGAATPGPAPLGPQTGDGAGRVLTEQSLEHDEDEDTKKSMTDAEAIAWVQERIPGVALASVCRVVELTKTLKRQGRL